MGTTADEESIWPRDQADYIFLGRAKKMFGAQRFGAEWTGTEYSHGPLLPLPAFSESATNRNRGARHEAHRLLLDETDYIACPLVHQPPPFGFEPKREGLDYEFSEGLWRRAAQIRESQIADAKPGWKRLVEVRRVLLEAFVAGNLATGLRDKKGATITPLAPAIWSVVDAPSVFEWHQLDPENLTNRAARGEAFKWVFVFRRDMLSFMETLFDADQAVYSARRALRNMMSTYPDTPCPKDLVFQRLAITHTKLSEREFDRLWPEVSKEVAPKWSKVGRRPQVSSETIETIIAALNRRT